MVYMLILRFTHHNGGPTQGEGSYVLKWSAVNVRTGGNLPFPQITLDVLVAATSDAVMLQSVLTLPANNGSTEHNYKRATYRITVTTFVQ